MIADYPGRMEDTAKRPFTGPAGRMVRAKIAELWQGPVAFDHALKCAPGNTEVKEKHADGCRPYLATVVREVRPQRIVTLGSWATMGLLGRKVPAAQVRGAYAWWLDEETFPAPESWVPVFMLPNPLHALRNRFVMRDFVEDLTAALTGPVPPVHGYGASTRIVETPDDARAAQRWCAEAEWVTADVETSGVMWESDFRVEVITFFRKHAGAVDTAGWTFDRDSIEDPSRCMHLQAILRDAAVRFIGHNAKYDVQALVADPLINTWVSRLHGDTRLWRKLVDGDVVANLAVTAELVGMGGHKHEAHEAQDALEKDLAKLAAEPLQKPLKPLKNGKVRVRDPYVPTSILAQAGPRTVVPEAYLEKLRSGHAVPVQYAYQYMNRDVRARYNGRDALSTAYLADRYEPEIRRSPSLTNVWTNITEQAALAFARVESHGCLIDPQANAMFADYVQQKLAEVDAKLAPYFPNVPDLEAALNSPKQLQALLFDQLKLPRLKETKTGWSTDGKVLEKLAGLHPVPALIVERRRYSYMDSHYATGLRIHIREDGRIHTSFLIDGADTGRVSSASPNLQNIPSPENEDAPELGVMARNQFVAPPGYLLLEGDQSQIELRVAAMISQDPLMMQFFQSGQDFHMSTARLIAPLVWKISSADFDKLPPEQRKLYRRSAKVVNFGLLYGKTAPGLAADLGCTVQKAQQVLDAVLGTFKRLTKWIAQQLANAKRDGGVHVPWNGKPANWRNLYGIAEQGDDARGVRSNAENATVNTPIQGWAAHFTTSSIGPIQDGFDNEGLDARVILTVHDSIMVEVREDQVDEAQEIMRQVMSSHPSMGVPLVVDFKRGHAWGSLKAS